MHFIIEAILAGCIASNFVTIFRLGNAVEDMDAELTYWQSVIGHVSMPAGDPRK